MYTSPSTSTSTFTSTSLSMSSNICRSNSLKSIKRQERKSLRLSDGDTLPFLYLNSSLHFTFSPPVLSSSTAQIYGPKSAWRTGLGSWRKAEAGRWREYVRPAEIVTGPMVLETSNDLSPDSWVQKRDAKRQQSARRSRPHKYLFIKLLSQPGGLPCVSVRFESCFRVLRFFSSCPSMGFLACGAACLAHCQAFAHFQIGFYQLNAILVQISYRTAAAAQDNGNFFAFISAPFGFSRSSASALDSRLLYGFGIISKAEIDFPFLLCTVFRVSVALLCWFPPTRRQYSLSI